MATSHQRSVSRQDEYRMSEPIAVVGMACKFPGANGLEAFWNLLESGGNAVTDGNLASSVGRFAEIFPDGMVQNEASRFAAFVDDVDQFDPGFFRISPLEAQYLDPQQRMMLEISWRALEDAGIDPEQLSGSRTGVYGGITHSDYREVTLGASNIGSGPASSLYAATGTSGSTAIGRVSYALGLQGPAISVDTACSSALVAIHQAVSGLRQDEADIALAGGVSLILSRHIMESRASAGMLSPDGRCKTFDASANGYVRGEGCGILVLKRLSDAEADGDRIWGVILGSAVNQDGASAGLTVPSGEAQELVIKDALRRSGVLPSQVDYVEAHGTGTPVGDPLELQAIAAAYGDRSQSEEPLFVGSVKTNFGHLESASGIAAMIKTILSMNHGLIPRHLNFSEPSDAIDWENLPIRVPLEATAWPSSKGRLPTAGVSGYGWSGTNAHVLVQGYHPSPDPSVESRGHRPPIGPARRVPVSWPGSDTGLTESKTAVSPFRILPISAKNEPALKELAERYQTWLDQRIGTPQADVDATLADLAWTAGVGRSHFAHRAGILFRDSDSLRDGLKAVADGDKGAESRASTKVAFVYTGQASQWVGMGRTLYETQPVVRAVLDRCERVIMAERGQSLLDVMFGREGAQGDLMDTAWAQPAIFSLECALTALWASVGVKPDVVIGHSFGELAAAQAAGVFGLEDGVRFVLKRGDALASVPERGAMVAVFASEERVEAAIQEINAASDGPELNISVYNGFQQVVSGPTAAVQVVAEHFTSQEIRARILDMGQAFHSVMVEPVLEDLEKSYEGVAVSPPSVALVSDVTGRVLEEGEILDAGYWRRHARQSVQFRKGIGALAELGVDVVVEIGPNAVLGPLVSIVWPGDADAEQAGPAPTILETMIRPYNDVATPESESAFQKAVAALYEAGLPVAFAGLFANEERRKIELPGYPFQRERYWMDASRRRRSVAGHPLLGEMRESPRGEVTFETEMYPSDPSWLSDHRVLGRVIMPGAVYGAMAAAVSSGGGVVEVADLQLYSPMVIEDDDSGSGQGGRLVQAILSTPQNGTARQLEIFSKGDSDDNWTLHADAKVSRGAAVAASVNRVDLDSIKTRLTARDVAAFYRGRFGAGVSLGPSFRTLGAIWSGDSEAVAEVALPEGIDGYRGELHPLLLDGCFQVMAAARVPDEGEEGAVYLPFGWERMWLSQNLPERLVCHARLSENAAANDGTPETISADLAIYTLDGVEIGGMSGYTVKRATRASLFSGTTETEDLKYEVVWRDSVLDDGMPEAGFLARPGIIAANSPTFATYLAAEDVAVDSRYGLLNDLERLSWKYALLALERLGWTREAGELVQHEALRERLNVLEEHRYLFRQLFRILDRPGVVEETDDGFLVKVGQGDPLPDGLPANPDEFADGMIDAYPHGSNEIGVFRRSANALADILVGRADPLTLLFSSGDPTAADLYLKAPAARAANRLIGDTIARLLNDLPEGRRIRVLEVGAGTGSATASVLPELATGRFEYIYTDISAGFFSEAEERFGDGDGAIQYRVLDIERDPISQGFDSHGYDLVIASNVLHATRYLNETLAHCRDLLRPSGTLVALENLHGQGWIDLTFGQLDGWWRFADEYRPRHALASPAIWQQALGDAGFEEIAVLGPEQGDSARLPDRGVIVARGPSEVLEPAGAWVLAGDRHGVAEELAAQLASRNQTVVLASPEGSQVNQEAGEQAMVLKASVELDSRESWRSLLESLPKDIPLNGVVHLTALDGHGVDATADDLGADAKRAGGSALALAQGIADADVTPEKGVWLVTRGGQVLERERIGELSGALLWGFGKVLAREAPHLRPRMIDLDPTETTILVSDLANELMYPDSETHIAYRLGIRQAARLVRAGALTERLTLPEGSKWLMQPAPSGAIEELQILDLPEQSVGSKDVRISVEAAGLNFSDVLLAINVAQEGFLGGEVCGQVIEIGTDVSSVSVGDRVVALAFDTFGSEVITREEMVTLAPKGISSAALATMPTVFSTSQVSFDLARFKAGERILIHAGSGGVGLSAIQLAQAAGAEIFATASAPKQAFLRSLGIKHVFDSRSTGFGQEILQATDGKGVQVALNSLTGEGFIEATLSCLAHGGRFIELAREGIYSKEEMAAARPDVDYHIVEIDVLKARHPEQAGAALKTVMDRLSAAEVEPLIHTAWSMTEAVPAVKFMRDARHIGKIVLTNSPLETGRLREDRSYLVTGGLGGIGIVLAGWLADHGAGAIVLNGRRAPDPEAENAIAALRERGARVQVELADVTDGAAMNAMFERIDATLPPLAGVIHSVGVLSDATVANQSWENFERVLWPKMIGAWHLHRATMNLDLDMFTLFSSAAGVLGNPGQANHAAANAFLDQLAAHRRALGLPGQTLAWGAWSDLGEAEEQRERIAGALEARGTGWMTPTQGMRAFEELTRQNVTSSLVTSVDWQTFTERIENVPPFLDEMVAELAGGAPEQSDSADDLMSQLRTSRNDDSERLLVSFLQKELQAVMRLPTVPSPTVGFFDLGMDSLMSVELRNRLNRAFAGEYVVSNTAVFDYPDVTALARHLSEEIGQLSGVYEAPTTLAAATPSPRPVTGVENDAIAIVGMACRLPGAKNLDEYWRMMASGIDAITDGRGNGNDWSKAVGDPHAQDTEHVRGAFVDDIEWFDSRFFRISPIEARMMDPQQRMMLETSWEALEDAGIDPEALRGSLTGVYAGTGGSEYRDLIEASGASGNYLGTTSSVTVGRVAFALGLEGPAMSIDMACASSLAAIHQAATALQRGEVDLALAGGVQVVLSQQVSRFMAEVGMLSPTGQCNPFDESANGYVRGEGCGMVVLKRLSEAEADGDRIWAIVKGSAVNQNGASAGLTVPNGPSQERVMEAALARAGVLGADVDYVETHAVGSQLGDAIEMRAIGSVYCRGREPERPLLVGTVKGNIGHLESAAGIAGVIKTVLAMKRGTLLKHPHFKNPNSQIDWKGLPVRVVADNIAWPPHSERPPLAAVSAFGISGSNAHVVMEGYGNANGGTAEVDNLTLLAGPPRPASVLPAGSANQASGERRTRLLPLSGRSEGALRDVAGLYLSWLDESSASLASEDNRAAVMADIAWTAGVGRSHFPHRAGIKFASLESLRDGLKSIAGMDANPDTPPPQPANGVAFLYSEGGSEWLNIAETLYVNEPVAQAVLDQCDEIVSAERGVSLLDVMFGRATDGSDLDDPAWTQPASYAVQCALTALWDSLGIRPSISLGNGVGELAAAQASGSLSLDEGMRRALGQDGEGSAAPELTPFRASPATLTALDVDVVVEIGAHPAPDRRRSLNGARSDSGPKVIDTTALLSSGGFAAAVAQAYEAGLTISFEGLFAGETRRRLSLPTYPFQRRRHWFR